MLIMPVYNPNRFDSTEDIRPIRSATPAGSGRGAALHGLSDFLRPLNRLDAPYVFLKWLPLR